MGNARRFLDQRTGWPSAYRRLLDAELEGGARWRYVFGTALALLLVVQAVTGLLLMLTYTPSVQQAWASVFYIQHRVWGGWFIRGLHHWGASAIQVVFGLHLLQVAIYGAYKRPREVNWWLGLALLVPLQGMAVTGYLLPWDQKGYWASHIVTNITGSVPLIGKYLQTLMVGGGSYGQPTLSRLFALHVGFLPVLLLILVVAHIQLAGRHGLTPPQKSRKEPARYFPRQALRDLSFAALALGAVVGLTVWLQGANLEAPADSAVDFPPRPEWYFLFLFQLLKYLPGELEWVGTLLLPTVGLVFLVALPLIDRAAQRRVRDRLPWAVIFLAGAGAVATLTALAVADDVADPDYKQAREEADLRAERSIELASAGIPPEGPLQMLADDPLTRGRDLYLQYCTSCHLFSGRGERKSPDHTGFGSRGWILAMLESPQAPHFFGKTGIDDMPSMSKLGDRALRDVTEFLFARGLEPQDPPVDEAMVARGKEVFLDKCMRCHVFKGEGDTLGTGAPDMTQYGSRTWIWRQTSTPNAPAQYGELNEMPAFADQMTVHDIWMVAGFLRQQRFAEPHFPEEPEEAEEQEAAD